MRAPRLRPGMIPTLVTRRDDLTRAFARASGGGGGIIRVKIDHRICLTRENKRVKRCTCGSRAVTHVLEKAELN